MGSIVRTERDVLRLTALQTLVCLATALPCTVAITYLYFGGDLSATISGSDALRFGLETTAIECGAICPLVAYRSLFKQRKLNSMRDRLHALASQDALTGLLNRRGFDEAGAGFALGSPVAALVCDLDHFKRVNDRFGHDAGDRVLRAVGKRLAELAQLDPGARLARFGGEEFVVALPGVGLDQARQWAEAARARIGARPVTGAGAPIPVTASFGVAAAEAFDGDLSKLIARADAALYRAKRAGRNGVRTERDAPEAAAA